MKTFVANRTSQILSITRSDQWRHVRTSENPADVITRGLTPKRLIDSSIWWNGPPWLVQDSHTWKVSEATFEEQDLPERRELKLALVVAKSTHNIIQHYSDWNKLKRGVAWLLRFKEYLKNRKSVSRVPYHFVVELERAEK